MVTSPIEGVHPGLRSNQELVSWEDSRGRNFSKHDLAAAASTYPVPGLAIIPSRSDNVDFPDGLHFRHDLCILLHMAISFLATLTSSHLMSLKSSYGLTNKARESQTEDCWVPATILSPLDSCMALACSSRQFLTFSWE